LNVYEIVVKTKPGTDPNVFKQMLTEAGVSNLAQIKTSLEAQPKFLQDIKTTFGMLGNIIGSIGLVVASITIFIVVFVNAITRRRFIGILKGIGISSTAIQVSYILQALFYALSGIILGSIVVFLVLKPFFDANPINFPFSDGILVATVSGTLARAGILIVATIIAGYVPSRIVIKENTLDAILGR
jgi:putative ABC transport system permease protein